MRKRPNWDQSPIVFHMMVFTMETELAELIYADIHRDGGSYSTSFTTVDGQRYNIWLERSRRLDERGLHHRFLFEYLGVSSPQNPLPVITGSKEERALLLRLNRFVERQPGDDAP